MHRKLSLTLGAALAAVALAGSATAATFAFTPPTGDRWMYPFNGTPGIRPNAPLFGAVGTPGFDNRDAQMLVQFDTGGSLASGLGASSYVVNSARLTVTLFGGDFAYDPTYDPYTSFLGGTDSDPGRPIELYGVGYRGGFNTLTFQETSVFGPPGPPTAGVRNAYSNDYFGGATRDVSNNVSGGFDSNPFAIGQILGITPGALPGAGHQVTFDLSLTPDVIAYLQNRLNLGRVDLMLSSFTPASQGGPPTYPIIWTKEGIGGTPARLDLDVTVVPEPATLALLGLGVLGLAALRRSARD